MKFQGLIGLAIVGTLLAACGGQQNSDETNSMTSPAGVDKSHFFSQAWGCVEFSQQDLTDNNYQIQDFTVETGACPETIAVLSEIARPLFTCDVPIGPQEIAGTYIFYDKRTLDDQTVDNLSGTFTAENFCPALLQRRSYN